MLPEKISYPGLLFPKAGTFASEVVAAIAAVELPVNHQGDLIEMLLGFVNIQTNVNLRIATLQSISFICKSIVSPTKQLSSVTLKVFSRRNLKSSPFAPTKSLLRSSMACRRKKVQLSVINALFNSLDFVRHNFEQEVCCAHYQYRVVLI
jgi:importin subunit beta-1